MAKIFEPTPEMKALLRRCDHVTNRNTADVAYARAEVAKALETPLRKGIMPGNIIDGIFEQVRFDYGTAVEFPLDFLAPGTEKDFVAYTVPSQGHIPQRNVEGDYVTVPTYMIGNSIDWRVQYARDARWDVLGRATQVLAAGFTKKLNDDGWHTIIAAGTDRNTIIFDSQASSGQFTKRLISLSKVVMRRNGGGNSSSVMRGQLTDMYVSPEAVEDMRNWGVDIVDEFTRREIFLADDNSGDVSKIFGVRLHALDELGENQEYQNFWTNQLAAALPTGRLEVCISLDLKNNDSFLNPVKQDISIVEDELLARQMRMGYFGSTDVGFAALDNRRVLLNAI